LQIADKCPVHKTLHTKTQIITEELLPWLHCNHVGLK
jgi:hypothetical protein